MENNPDFHGKAPSAAQVAWKGVNYALWMHIFRRSPV